MKPWIAWASTGLLWIGLMSWYLARRLNEGFQRTRCACLGHVWDIGRAIEEARPITPLIPGRPYLELKSLHCIKCGKVLELKMSLSAHSRVRIHTTVEVYLGTIDNWVKIEELTVEELGGAFLDMAGPVSNLVQQEHKAVWDEICRRLKLEWKCHRGGCPHHLENCCVSGTHEPQRPRARP